ncbi:MAG: putative solute:sodium symporter small subunit [Paraglaciecola psychrophila]|jgi:putative solute:sodium symporter small subunit
MTDENKVSANEDSNHPLLSQSDASSYWRENILLLIKLLIVWFIASFGFGILLVEQLNQFSLFGMQLGFWFAQQGSIYVFIVLIFTYVVRIKKIEQRYGVDDSAELTSSDKSTGQSL